MKGQLPPRWDRFMYLLCRPCQQCRLPEPDFPKQRRALGHSLLHFLNVVEMALSPTEMLGRFSPNLFVFLSVRREPLSVSAI